jgi:hypothetical protein
MMSCTTSATWSHHISSPCYTEYGQSCGAVLSGRITTVAMSRSEQLGLHCSVEPNCSGLCTRLADASVICDRVLDTVRWGSWGTWQHRSSPLREARAGPRGSVGAYLNREVRSRAEEHVAASESTLAGRRGLELRNTWQRRNSTQ